MISLDNLNRLDQPAFVTICGPFFEHSPWIAERTWTRRPFFNLKQLHESLCATMRLASVAEQLSLINAHPDLVGRMAREGSLTRESTTEQSAAGLTQLSAEDVEQFNRLNAIYRQRYGFPFIICARENKKEAILHAFPIRLLNAHECELQTALDEIAKIARLRLHDAVREK